MNAAKNKAPARGLGKGLSALMSESYGQIQDTQDDKVTDIAAVRAPESTLPLSVLQAGKYQPRMHFNEAALQELSESIRKNGVMQPILVRPLEHNDNRYEIIAGERRFRAAKLAGLSEIPVIIKSLTHEEALEIALIENIQRQDLKPLEEAAGYQRLMDEFDYTQEQLSHAVHKSRSHVANLLRLLSLPEEIRDLLASDAITMGHARSLMGNPEAVLYAREIVARGLSVRETEKLMRANKLAPRLAAAPKEKPASATVHVMAPAQHHHQHAERDPDIVALEETLSENLGLKVTISDRGQSGEITVSYESLEQLDDVLRRLGGGI